MDPESARSRPPIRCSRVLFPTPDAPTIATISPRATSRSMSRMTCSRCAPTGYDLFKPEAETNDMSLEPQRLHRVEPGGLPRRVDRGEEADDDRRYHDDHEIEGPH